LLTLAPLVGGQKSYSSWTDDRLSGRLLNLLKREYHIKMTTKKAQHGGTGRGQGRKPLIAGQPMVPVTVKMTAPQKDKLGRLGGAPWVRERIDKAKEPK
jgi:hypothetical protein